MTSLSLEGKSQKTVTVREKYKKQNIMSESLEK